MVRDRERSFVAVMNVRHVERMLPGNFGHVSPRMFVIAVVLGRRSFLLRGRAHLLDLPIGRQRQVHLRTDLEVMGLRERYFGVRRELGGLRLAAERVRQFVDGSVGVRDLREDDDVLLGGRGGRFLPWRRGAFRARAFVVMTVVGAAAATAAATATAAADDFRQDRLDARESPEHEIGRQRVPPRRRERLVLVARLRPDGLRNRHRSVDERVPQRRRER